jgi:KDO2-lipid IV(A) lauroyltransferase
MKYRLEVVYSNLKNSIIDKNELEIKEIEKKFYKHFCDIMFESLKVLTITNKQIYKRFKILNPE